MDVSDDQLRRAIEGQHGGTAKFAYVSRVREMFGDKLVWEGQVHVFDLEGNPNATRAYAWSSTIEGSDKRRSYAVLHLSGIRSPLDAARAAIVAEGANEREAVAGSRCRLSNRRRARGRLHLCDRGSLRDALTAN